jgi:hypothetical protein
MALQEAGPPGMRGWEPSLVISAPSQPSSGQSTGAQSREKEDREVRQMSCECDIHVESFTDNVCVCLRVCVVHIFFVILATLPAIFSGKLYT